VSLFSRKPPTLAQARQAVADCEAAVVDAAAAFSNEPCDKTAIAKLVADKRFELAQRALAVAEKTEADRRRQALLAEKETLLASCGSASLSELCAATAQREAKLRLELFESYCQLADDIDERHAAAGRLRQVLAELGETEPPGAIGDVSAAVSAIGRRIRPLLREAAAEKLTGNASRDRQALDWSYPVV